MGTPQLTAAQIQEISALVANYIRTQRESFAGRAANLPAALRLPLAPFFRADVLNSTGVLVLENERVANPDFYPMLQSLGFTNLPDFGGMAAITFQDVVVSHEPWTPPLLFHELVHVEQYRQLGVDRFAELYVRGFLEGGCYEAIPLEVNAYGLEGAFRNAPHRGFSVEQEVVAWLHGDEEDEVDLGFGPDL
jgi:hypothetical protein